MSNKRQEPKYAPGMDDTDIIPKASKEDKARKNVTVETRVFLDENDPSGEEE